MRRLVRPTIVVLVLLAAGWATRTVGLAGPLTPAGLRTLVDAYAPWGGLAFMALCGASGALYALPPLLIIAVGGAVLGPRLAFVYGWSGLLAGALLAFGLVRLFARDQVAGLVGRRFPGLRLLDERLVQYGFVTVLALRAVLALSPPLTWALAATRVRPWDHAAATALGGALWVAAAAFLGDTMVADDPWLSPRVLGVAGVTLVVLVAAGAIGRRLLGGVRLGPPSR